MISLDNKFISYKDGKFILDKNDYIPLQKIYTGDNIFYLKDLKGDKVRFYRKGNIVKLTFDEECYLAVFSGISHLILNLITENCRMINFHNEPAFYSENISIDNFTFLKYYLYYDEKYLNYLIETFPEILTNSKTLLYRAIDNKKLKISELIVSKITTFDQNSFKIALKHSYECLCLEILDKIQFFNKSRYLNKALEKNMFNLSKALIKKGCRIYDIHHKNFKIYYKFLIEDIIFLKKLPVFEIPELFDYIIFYL